jgi:hypothetical protein
MVKLAFAIVFLCALGLLIAAIAIARRPDAKKAEERRKRFVINETEQRLPLAGEKVPEPAPSQELFEPVEFTEGTIYTPRDKAVDRGWVDSQRGPEEMSAEAQLNNGSTKPGVTGRVVRTAEGEAIITEPPFAARGPLFTYAQGRFVNLLVRRLPVWVIVMPRVRLDALCTPTKPDGRDVEDWREWRKRVRSRSVDLVLCDRRTWKPLLAIVFARQSMIAASKIGGGEDHILDEVLRHIHIPMVRLSGRFQEDWPIIKPYVEHTILPSSSDEAVLEASTRTAGMLPEAAVRLLKMDGEKGWLLE